MKKLLLNRFIPLISSFVIALMFLIAPLLTGTVFDGFSIINVLLSVFIFLILPIYSLGVSIYFLVHELNKKEAFVGLILNGGYFFLVAIAVFVGVTGGV